MSREFSRRPRLYVPDPLTTDIPLMTSAEQNHYLQHVLRQAVGAMVRLFNGRDGEWIGRIEAFDKRGATISPERQTRPQSAEADLWLLFAPLKRDHLDFLVQKASELGVARLQPIMTQHTQSERINIQRLSAIAKEAAEQCERLTLPCVMPPCGLTAALESVTPPRRLVAALESGPATPLAMALPPLRGIPAAVLIGPEGGFGATELEEIRNVVNAIVISLGPRILRAETAAISALACWQGWCGDWTAATPDADPL